MGDITEHRVGSGLDPVHTIRKKDGAIIPRNTPIVGAQALPPPVVPPPTGKRMFGGGVKTLVVSDSEFQSHISDFNNPHQVTAAQVDAYTTDETDDLLAAIETAIESRTISTTAPLTGGGNLSANRTFAITAADGSNAGSMSASHYTIVNSTTALNTANSVVYRGASGQFAAGTITCIGINTTPVTGGTYASFADAVIETDRNTGLYLMFTNASKDINFQNGKLILSGAGGATFSGNIISAGNVGIGTDSPDEMLHLESSGLGASSTTGILVETISPSLVGPTLTLSHWGGDEGDPNVFGRAFVLKSTGTNDYSGAFGPGT